MYDGLGPVVIIFSFYLDFINFLFFNFFIFFIIIIILNKDGCTDKQNKVVRKISISGYANSATRHDLRPLYGSYRLTGRVTLRFGL